MTIVKKSIHALITLTSFVGFLAGWAFLAQAARETAKQTANNSGLLTVANLPPIQNVNNMLHTLPSRSSGLQNYSIDPSTPTPEPTVQPLPTLAPQQSQTLLFTPPLRTKGS